MRTKYIILSWTRENLEKLSETEQKIAKMKLNKLDRNFNAIYWNCISFLHSLSVQSIECVPHLITVSFVSLSLFVQNVVIVYDGMSGRDEKMQYNCSDRFPTTVVAVFYVVNFQQQIQTDNIKQMLSIGKTQSNRSKSAHRILKMSLVSNRQP